ncbi:hypothetical protein BCR33DRAFT_390728 [Rhizoclosmatium globosum]|uniref:Uncharacterized protein n=1 Tax=Rhizoclosmatium globosum TaxID=329046 RepID=A0A1Y2BXR5_9FUNG|nr:hypothetical protein BCR33DRAFT_390728 [Rhizoclosmatium globosum]|eukprot:ORY39536.1 hypothetical protein BCR33DRAFT_390728 [Rhizoclosmatium globosum]
MDYLMQWCLVCERKLDHGGLYCSSACLRSDFLLTPFPLPSGSLEGLRVSPSWGSSGSNRWLKTKSAPLPLPLLAPPQLQPQPPSLSASESSQSTTTTTLSLRSFQDAVLHPPLSLSFQSRPRSFKTAQISSANTSANAAFSAQ